MENKLKNKESNSNNTSGGKSIFSGFGRLEEAFETGKPVKFMPKILFVAFILVLYIMNSYLIEKKRIGIQKVKAQIEDLRTDYTTLKADYMLKSKQSEVVKRVEELGLVESKTTPIRIVIHKED